MKKQRKTTKFGTEKIVKTLPLAFAASVILSGGTAMASNMDGIDIIRVDTGSNNVMQFDVNRMRVDSAYADFVKASMKSAFNGGDEFLMKNVDGQWFDIGSNLVKGMPIDAIFKNPDLFAPGDEFTPY